jgi:hypothetical protein
VAFGRPIDPTDQNGTARIGIISIRFFCPSAAPSSHAGLKCRRRPMRLWVVLFTIGQMVPGSISLAAAQEDETPTMGKG